MGFFWRNRGFESLAWGFGFEKSSWVLFRDGFGMLSEEMKGFFMVEGVEKAENGRHGLLWIVNVATMGWSSWDGRPWGDWGWEMMKERDLVDGKEWSEKRCWEDWKRTSLDFKRRNWLLKSKCEFRTRWIVKCENFHIPVIFQDREHAFWKMLRKAISHKGVGWCEFRWVLAFLPCFPLFSPWLHSSSFPTCMLTSKTNSSHIRMKLRSKIKIKTCLNTRKTLD